MGSSNSPGRKGLSIRVVWILFAVIALAEAGFLLWNVGSKKSLSQMGFNTPLSSNTAVYRYKFGNAVNMHYLDDVVSISIYRRPEAIDQVVFFQENTDYYVLNADMLVDYRLSEDSSIETRDVMNALFHHYDPYLQGEKQEMHRQWVLEQYQRYTGRGASDEEWLAALNELTRGVEHYQMERWIAYSPPAIDYWLTSRLPEQIGKTLNEVEQAHLTELLQSGITYEQIEARIGN